MTSRITLPASMVHSRVDSRAPTHAAHVPQGVPSLPATAATASAATLPMCAQMGQQRSHIGVRQQPLQPHMLPTSPSGNLAQQLFGQTQFTFTAMAGEQPAPAPSDVYT